MATHAGAFPGYGDTTLSGLYMKFQLTALILKLDTKKTTKQTKNTHLQEIIHP